MAVVSTLIKAINPEQKPTGMRTDDGWGFICGLKNLPHPAFSSSCLPITGGKAGLLYVKLNTVILI